MLHESLLHSFRIIFFAPYICKKIARNGLVKMRNVAL
uniref:Uncharacterized protein n=1 Tax=Anguilla anguilla TaxID=7936 RepID=A0A0E9UKB0_ANGAN